MHTYVLILIQISRSVSNGKLKNIFRAIFTSLSRDVVVEQRAFDYALINKNAFISATERPRAKRTVIILKNAFFSAPGRRRAKLTAQNASPISPSHCQCTKSLDMKL
jgi:hypothetical protein